MVGDGMIDAPVLVTADIGIVVSAGSDIAIEFGGITLVKGSLNAIVVTITLFKKP